MAPDRGGMDRGNSPFRREIHRCDHVNFCNRPVGHCRGVSNEHGVFPYMAKFPDCIRSTLAASKTLIALSLISCRWPLEAVRRIPIVADMACRLATLICPAVTALAMSLGPVIASFGIMRSEEHTSELQSLMRISYAVL